MPTAIDLPTPAAAPAGPRRITAIALFAARKLGGAVLVLFLAGTLTFIVLKLAGGDPVSIALGPNGISTPDARAALAHQFNLDRPVWEQYLLYLRDLAVGNLGTSYTQRAPVSVVIGPQLGPTVELAVTAGALAVILGTVSGLLVSRSRKIGSLLIQGLEILAASIPTFWLGILLLTVFSFTLHWLPVSGADGPQALILPSIALALPLAAVLAQVVRENATQTIRAPFVLSARARGITELRITLGHIAKHTAGTAINVAGWFIGGLLGGAVLTESVFGRPGIGQLALSAVISRDMPVVMSVVFLSAVVYVVINTGLDVIHAALDPRINRER
ncbi:MAG: ABC transporter permease [Gordonia sp. (in: high G+C Gram-positive bacteria)]